jgi:predicted nucleic-acid-binding Zn-ribbon protein
MELTKEQGDKLLKLVSNQKTHQTCPLCGSQLFCVSDTIFMLLECTGKNMVFGKGQFQPVFSISCEKCGYTFLINALKSGIITEKDLESQKLEVGV